MPERKSRLRGFRACRLLVLSVATGLVQEAVSSDSSSSGRCEDASLLSTPLCVYRREGLSIDDDGSMPSSSMAFLGSGVPFGVE